jgi:hypothetical protein
MLMARILLTTLRVFALLVVAAMIKLQIPELQYDLGTKNPMPIESLKDLSTRDFGRSTFVSVHGKTDMSKAATFAKHGVRYTYFLLTGYGNKLVVRSPETPNEKWADIDFHVGRLRPYGRMPFSRSVRAGFAQLFGVHIPSDAFSLARDDVPGLSGWTVGAISFAGILWCVLAYFFFIRRRINRLHVQSGDGPTAHHGQPEPAGNQPRNDRSEADQDT